ncbi:hypothetical protein KDA_15130 [Dictyobacter alpinus]|uniref:Uncharacterized protein n=1 Tax=Dictyobacter alpinus TaxID=2014873 RepID=A0A402B3V1_9CHLR|nr:hypothetical protein KDA_15130 [Dictyobacter alpinus]
MLEEALHVLFLRNITDYRQGLTTVARDLCYGLVQLRPGTTKKDNTDACLSQ